MSQRIDNLIAVATSLRTAVENGVAIQDALKSRLTAAVSANATATAQIAQLQSDLAAAQASGLSAADATAIDSLAASLQATTQNVVDHNTVNDPAN